MICYAVSTQYRSSLLRRGSLWEIFAREAMGKGKGREPPSSLSPSRAAIFSSQEAYGQAARKKPLRRREKSKPVYIAKCTMVILTCFGFTLLRYAIDSEICHPIRNKTKTSCDSRKFARVLSQLHGFA